MSQSLMMMSSQIPTSAGMGMESSQGYKGQILTCSIQMHVCVHTHPHMHTHTHIVGYNPFGSDSDEDESGSGISSSQPPASYGYHVSPLPKSPTNQGSAELLNRASLHGTDSSGGSARNSPLMKGTCDKLQFVFS